MAYNQMSIYPDTITSDIQLKDGAIMRSTNSDAILENVKQRLLTIEQEWFLDLEQGLPWFTELTGRNTSIEKIRAYVSQEIRETVGVFELLSLNIAMEQETRKLEIAFEYRDIFGQTIREII